MVNSLNSFFSLSADICPEHSLYFFTCMNELYVQLKLNLFLRLLKQLLLKVNAVISCFFGKSGEELYQVHFEL